MKEDNLRALHYRLVEKFIRSIPAEPNHLNQLLGRLRNRDHLWLSKVTSHLPYSALQGANVWVQLRQVEAFFKKNAYYADDTACSQAAWESFQAAEEQCKMTNERFDQLSNQHCESTDLIAKLDIMRDVIRRTLGDFRTFLDQIPDRVKMTSGATYRLPKRKAGSYKRINPVIRASSTYGAMLIRDLAVYRGVPDRILSIRVDPRNRVSFVPKSSSTHRTITCEQDHSVPIQLAFDSFLKERLMRIWGINLRSQVWNQVLALNGSIFGSYATIDLKAASDTVSFNLVQYLLDGEWLMFVNAFRSRFYVGPYGNGTYHKFSSMGNGMTFVLETLIFAAACIACGAVKGDFSVYGDDIIVPTDISAEVIDLLRELGFETNKDKTFVEGPFRESCGADYLNGKNVTPFYVREYPKSKAGLCHYLNGMSKVCSHIASAIKDISDVVRREELPLVPVSEDTMTGIHIPAYYLHERRLLPDLGLVRGKERSHILCYKGYRSFQGTKGRAFDRTYYLWHAVRKDGEPVTTSLVADGFPRYLLSEGLVYHPKPELVEQHHYLLAEVLLRPDS